MKDQFPIYITRPSLPPLQEFYGYLEQIWATRYITNNGPLLQEFENKLGAYLGVKYISVVSNGTLALMIALKALEVKGEVITSPFSFIATTNAIQWCGLKPVFVDIEKNGFNLDATLIEAAITRQTAAVLPIHVYGHPCEVKNIAKVAARYDLKVLYDAAHCYGVNKGEESILNFGDMAILSFHATKTFNTIEGGAIVCHTPEMKARIDQLRNFGYDNEDEIQIVGINAKMNELQAAYGLVQLGHVETQIENRKKIYDLYHQGLSDLAGIQLPTIPKDLRYNYTYFPILIDERKYGLSREAIFNRLKSKGIYSRKYFYPLISNLGDYVDLPSASPENLPIANRTARQVLCLPIFEDLSREALLNIVETIQKKG